MTPSTIIDYRQKLKQNLERFAILTDRLDDWDDEWTDADEEEYKYLKAEIEILENKIKKQIA